MRERDHRLLTLRATNATFAFHLELGQVLLATPRLSIGGTGNATFQSSEGSLNYGSQKLPLLNEPLRASGRFDLETWNQSASQPRLRARLYVEASAVSVPAEAGNEGFKASITVPTTLGSALLWLAAAAALLVLLLGVAFARRREIRIEEVEWAVLGGQGRRAHRLAGRLVNREPRNPDAVFLYGASFLMRGRHARLLRELEPLAARIPRTLRRGIAYLLAVSAFQQGEAGKARRWGREASEEPLLLAQMKEQGVWTGLFRKDQDGPTPDSEPVPGYS